MVSQTKQLLFEVKPQRSFNVGKEEYKMAGSSGAI
jgi:hypothetical protein